ncbi:protein of unknown function [Acidithiobacillus ferrivorans]|uniref:Uncharacterized protein n=1 Tax=Acidithiobacillus ferrivorans TaxID=160808 RepID=A0ABY1MM85_9PROT|nr:protein of unknown function [Acidithiobacillus ferrivorans]
MHVCIGAGMRFDYCIRISHSESFAETSAFGWSNAFTGRKSFTRLRPFFGRHRRRT